ncbi:MAG: hypothetical protein FWC70_00620 [Defluviitaleaceae bacterium]|nr:hypothetical protein [Defluviitaleaceae bacterium]
MSCGSEMICDVIEDVILMNSDEVFIVTPSGTRFIVPDTQLAMKEEAANDWRRKNKNIQEERK